MDGSVLRTFKSENNQKRRLGPIIHRFGNEREAREGEDPGMTGETPRLSEEIKADVAKQHSLRPVETVEKNVLPTKEEIQQERQHHELKKGIESFDESTLNKVETQEKCALPSGEDILKEKAPQMAADFDRNKLKHVEPQVKAHIPDAEEYVREKVKSEASTFDHDKLRHVEPEVKTDVVVNEN
ncbi:unnamed protein product [Bursaphelenchus xylophilus]|uniref:(pine wood nematode) hypothetical protein n=1 Tax=Bursaphelenchus xylophilus TaxID=6326 RepID=A0A811LGF9_BURXY|nr:unnamed protein product [Bursaphelenchus xylophilus]CAG9115990.1 unnamed protein product [Bursaphelenchus xylophilus]